MRSCKRGRRWQKVVGYCHVAQFSTSLGGEVHVIVRGKEGWSFVGCCWKVAPTSRAGVVHAERARFGCQCSTRAWGGIIESFGGWFVRNEPVFSVDTARGCRDVVLKHSGRSSRETSPFRASTQREGVGGPCRVIWESLCKTGPFWASTQRESAGRL